MPKAKKKTKGAEPPAQDTVQHPFFDLHLPDVFEPEDVPDDDRKDPDYVLTPSGESSSETSGDSDQRAVDKSNLNVSPDDFIENSRSGNTRRQDEWVKRLYSSTMKSVAFNSGLSEFPPLLQTHIEDLPGNLERFCMSLVKKTGESYNPSSTNQVYAVTARVLSMQYDPPLDIKTDVRFRKLSLIVKSKKEAAVKEGKTPGMNASKAVDPNLISKAYDEGLLGRGSPTALQRTVCLHLMSGFGTRAREEVRQILQGDLIFGPLDADGYPAFIILKEKLTKTRRGDSSRKLEPTIYKDDGYPHICAVRTLCSYLGRLTDEQKQPEKPFLLNLNHAAVRNPDQQRNWFTSSPAGKNNIASLFKSAFEALGVDCKAEKISATSARKNFLQGGAEAGVPANWLSLAAGHQVEQSQLNYLKMKGSTDKAMSICINRAVSGVKNQMDTDFRNVLNNGAAEKKINTGQETAAVERPMIEPDSGAGPHNTCVKQSLHPGMQQPNQMALQNLQPHMQQGLQQQMMSQPGPSFAQMPMSLPQMMPQPVMPQPMMPQPMMPQPMMPQPVMQQPMMPQPVMTMMVQPQQTAMMPMIMSPQAQPALVYPQHQQTPIMSPQMSSYGYGQQPMFFNPSPNRQGMMDITNTPGANNGNVPSRLKQIGYLNQDKEN